MGRTKIPEVLKESLLEGEYIRRLYRRTEDNKSFTPIGWAIIDSDNTPLYTVTDLQCYEFENLYDLFFTQYKTTGDSQEVKK